MTARSRPEWRLVDLGTCSPVRAVAFAEAAAPFVARGAVPNTLILARTSAPLISLGFHQSFVEELDPAFLRRQRLPVVRRVEGGGTVYLDGDQLFYQFVYQSTDEHPGGASDFAECLRAPIRAVRSLGVPAVRRPPSDVVVGDRKLGGSAGGEWEGAQILTGDILGRANVRAMADLLRLPHPALRPLLRREIARRMTSLRLETGREPDWVRVKGSFLDAFQRSGLGRLRAGPPTGAEETTFLAETVPRHSRRSWRERAPPRRGPSAPLRRIRVAGPHGLMVFDDPEHDRLLVAVLNGSRTTDAFCVGRGSALRLRKLRRGEPGYSALIRRAKESGGFE
ncbi:MAG TPA: hypothetical protein VEH28_04125 [Thermoplasmata archaeon]|nr:hypothetical protein [Thermoplasmata archaeon]